MRTRNLWLLRAFLHNGGAGSHCGQICKLMPEETIVAITSDFEQRMKHIRAGIRLNSRVAVAVEWTEGGRTLRAEGYTVDISAKGCLAIFPQGFTVGQRLRLINLTNQHACDSVLVWRGHEGRGGWELGLELQKLPADFWGLDF
jgi:PilZ domain